MLLAKKSILELTFETTELFNVIKEYTFPRPRENGQEIRESAGTKLSNVISLINSKCLEVIDYVYKGQLPGNQNYYCQKVA